MKLTPGRRRSARKMRCAEKRGKTNKKENLRKDIEVTERHQKHLEI